MPAFWASIETKLYGNSEERMNEKIITDLIQMHISISTTNTLLEKKLPDMQKNCMKAQPEIS